MTVDERVGTLLALLKVNYLMSDETDRIPNAKRNDEKYVLLCETWQNCYDLAEQYKGKLEGNNPTFPCDCNYVELVFPTETEEIVLREVKEKLADAIRNADEVNMDTDIKGNLRMFFGFENVYTPREV